jgi:hypothetical protein
MNVLLSTLKAELKTLQKAERRYLTKIKHLSQGSIFVRTVGTKRYGYLTRREGGHVVQDYLGSLDDKTIQHYLELMKQKREAKGKLKSVREQLKFLERALRGKTTYTGY